MHRAQMVPPPGIEPGPTALQAVVQTNYTRAALSLSNMRNRLLSVLRFRFSMTPSTIQSTMVHHRNKPITKLHAANYSAFAWPSTVGPG